MIIDNYLYKHGPSRVIHRIARLKVLGFDRGHLSRYGFEERDF